MSNETKPDLWDDCGAFWFRGLPADTIESFVSGEGQDMLKIEKDRGSYWLSETGRTGAGDYATLEAAKLAGDEIIDELYAKQDETLTRDAGLDPAEWRFRNENDYVWFEALSPSYEAGTTINREGRDRWNIQVGDAELEGQQFKSAKDAAEYLAQRLAFTPTI